MLISLLANYNKFEFQNPYQLRLNDFINETTIQIIIRAIGSACESARNDYILVQDDLPDGWTLSSTMNMLGLGAIAPGPKIEKKPIHDAETAKQLFTQLYGKSSDPLKNVNFDLTKLHEQTKPTSCNIACHLRFRPCKQAVLLQFCFLVC